MEMAVARGPAGHTQVDWLLALSYPWAITKSQGQEVGLGYKAGHLWLCSCSWGILTGVEEETCLNMSPTWNHRRVYE